MFFQSLTASHQKLRQYPCKPGKLTRGGHAQTILGHLLPSSFQTALGEGQRIEIPVSDGDRLIARHIAGSGNTVLYLFHGLGSSISAGYMRRTAALAKKLGCDIYLVNHRGCGEGQGLAGKPYHSGRADDLGAAIELGRKRHPEKRHVAVGFSLSANALLLLASGKHGKNLPDAAIAVNGPIDLARASLLLRKGLSRIYDYRFAIECRVDVLRRQKLGLLGEEKYDFPLWMNLRDFDRIYTGPAAGFQTRENYYATCSAAPFLQHVQIPTVLLSAKDDPFIDYRDYQNAKLSSNVIFHLEDFGGHLGYLNAEPTPLGTRRWLDYALFEYLTALTN
jgi:predicted alpha/beta-fold hydrolase